MGAEQSKGENQNTYEKLIEKYQITKKIDHPTFGEFQILVEKSTNRQMGLKEFNLTDESEFNKTIERYKPKLQLDNVNIIKLENCIPHKESQFCSTFFKVYLLFEYLENTIEQEIFERSKEVCQPFSEEEMWNILTSSISGIHFLYENKLNHCNISPSTIYITSDGIVKLADPQLFSQPLLYATALSNPSHVPKGLYLAPELLNEMYQQQYNPVYNQQKSDIFSLGMSLLHAALLQPLDDCYDYKNFSINENLIQERLFQVKEMYGANIYDFLSLMLAFNPEGRHDLTYFNGVISQLGDQQDSPTFQQVDVNQQQSTVAHSQISKSPERQYQPYEIIVTKTTTITTNPNNAAVSTKNEDDKVKRSPANPNQSQVIPQQQQSQIILSKIGNAQSGYSSQGMFKDTDDKGSTIGYIPKDQNIKNAIPDENFGNAIGGGNYTQNQADQNNTVSKTTSSNTYGFQQSNNYVPSVEPYKSNVTPSQQDYTNKYQPTSTTTVTTYSTPGISSYNPPSVNISSTQKYSAAYQPTNTYEVSKTQVPSSNIGGSTSGFYTSTKDQSYTPNSNQAIPTSQYTSDSFNKPYQTTSLGLKENNFSYTPGPTNVTGSTITTTNITSTMPQNLTSGNPYTSSNLYTTPGINNNRSSSFLTKDEAIEEAIKRSAPPPLKNEISQTSSYSVSSGANATQVPKAYTPSTSIQATQPQTSTITKTTITTNTGGYDPYKPSDEIEVILSKYRNQRDLIIGNTTNTDNKVQTNITKEDPQNAQSNITTTTNYNISSNQNYQPYNSSTQISNIGQTGSASNDYKVGYEGITNQFSGMNLTSNQPSSNIAISQVQSNYTANFQPSVVSNTYQTNLGINNAGVSSAPYTQSYQTQQSFGQSQPFSGQYEQNVSSSNQYQTSQDKEYVIENYSNNSKYEGEKQNGMRHGRGKFYYQDGGLFDGEWRENKMHGKGVLSYASGTPAYDGDWVDDKFEGFGVLYNENPAQLHENYDYRDFDNVEEFWTKYEGQFKDDNKEGFGTLYLSNGEKFVGTFYKDFVNGSGTFYNLNGNVIQGTWNQNKFVNM